MFIVRNGYHKSSSGEVSYQEILPGAAAFAAGCPKPPKPPNPPAAANHHHEKYTMKMWKVSE